MRDVVIVAAKRTAVGSFGGGLSSLSADKLGSAVIKALLEETGVAADQVNEVVLGQVPGAYTHLTPPTNPPA